MKKILLFALALGTALAVVSCKKTATPALDLSKDVDDSVWLDNLTDGKIAAQKADKKIILFFSADDQDQLSQILKDNLLNTDEFISQATEKYVLVNLDFSDALYEKTFFDENTTDEDRERALAWQKKMDENMKTATLYNVMMSPTCYLLTKEGYVITQLLYDDTTTTIVDFEDEINNHAETIAQFEETLAKTTTGTTAEKIAAIDALYEELTTPQHAYLLHPLARQVIQLDSKNESGLVGKYVLALAQVEATDAALDNDIERMLKAFEQAAKHKYTDDDQKQMMYYYAGYYLAGTGSTDYERVREYIQKSYDIAPQSDIAPEIQNLIRVIDERINDTVEMNDNVQFDDETEESAADAAQDAQGANSFTIE